MRALQRLLSILISCLATASFSQIQSGDNVVVRDKILDDLYIAGGTVTIDAPVSGDLIIAGGTISVNDTVTQDILAAGGNITLNGYVGDDIRCAGGVINITNHVVGDVIVTGGNVHVNTNATVEGDLISSGGKVSVAGNVRGELRNASGEFTMNGRVGRDVHAKGGKITINGTVDGPSVLAASTIELGARASFGNDVRYWSENQPLEFHDAIQGGRAIYDSSLATGDGKWHYLGFASFLFALWYLGMALVMIIAIQYLFVLALRNAANTAMSASLKSLGFGFLFFLGMPIVIVLCVITLIGIPIGILLLIGYLVLLLFATVIVSLLVANWVNNHYYHSSWGSGRIVIAAFVIFIFLKLVSLIPVVGQLMMLLLAAVCFGAILLNIKWRHKDALALPRG